MHLDVPYISARRVRHNLGAFGMTAALGLFSVGGLANRCAPAPPPIEQVANVQQPVVDVANQHRTQAGLGAVSIDQRLTNAAQSHANDMAARSVMTHTGAGGTNAGQRINAAGYGWTTWAENVAAGQTTAWRGDERLDEQCWPRGQHSQPQHGQHRRRRGGRRERSHLLGHGVGRLTVAGTPPPGTVAERAPNWSPERESNSRPTHYECVALPTELSGRAMCAASDVIGLPPTPRLS